VTRSGLGVDSNISSVKLFVDGVQRGTSQSLGSTHKATFSLTSNPIVVSANTTQEIVLAADIIAAPTYDMHVLGIADASDITTTATLSGTFPINGNVMTLANVTIGTATIAAGSLNPGTTSGDTGVDPDQTSYRFSQIKITAGATEAINISQLTAIKNGTAASSDVKSVELYNDTAGTSLGIVESLDADGRAVFDDLNLEIAKGGKVELSIKADLTNGSGRTIGFDAHDGTSSTILLSGVTYGYGITPTVAAAFCDTGVTDYTCQRQTITQGFLTVSKSASAPATGKIAVGGTEIPLMAFDYVVSGEPINVSQTVIKYTTASSGSIEDYTNWRLYLSDGTPLAGPMDGSNTGADSTETLTFTDAYTLPVGTNVVYVKADVSSSAVATETVYVHSTAGTVTAKGANAGKTVYTTSSGTTVPPAAVITGNTMTLQGPTLTVVTAATPIAGNVVVNAQDQEFAYVDLDASASAEDIRVTTIIIEDQVTGGTTTYTGVNNLELWGDADNTDTDDSVVKLATSNSTAINAQITTFTFAEPLRVKKGTSSRLTLKMDVVNLSASTTHNFNIGTDGSVTTDIVTATGWGTGEDATITYSGTGQVQTVSSVGILKVEPGVNRPQAAQFVAGTTGNEMMTYKLTSSYEAIDITDFYIATTSGTAQADVAKVKLYVDGVQVGTINGYTLNAGGDAHIVLDSGTIVVPKDDNVILSIKIDLAIKSQLTDAATLEIGIGDDDGDDSVWTTQDGTAVSGSYLVVATGQSSGTAIAPTTIDSLGTNAGDISASYIQYLYDGVLTVSKNASSPSGTQTAGPGSEVLRLNLTATGDDITINDIEFDVAGTCTVAGTAVTTLVSEDGNVIYESWAAAAGLNLGDFNVSIDGGAAFTNTLQIGAGQTKVVILKGDTTGCASTETLSVSLTAPTASNGTTAGIEWQNVSANNVDSALTRTLPVVGGGLAY